MYDLSKGSTRVKLEYDPSKVDSNIRNCAKYAHRASQSAKSAAAAAKLKTYWLLPLTWQFMNSCMKFRTMSRMCPAGRICVGLVPQTLGRSGANEPRGHPRTKDVCCVSAHQLVRHENDAAPTHSKAKRWRYKSNAFLRLEMLSQIYRSTCVIHCLDARIEQRK